MGGITNALYLIRHLWYRGDGSGSSEISNQVI